MDGKFLTLDEIESWREFIYEGDQMVTMRKAEFDRLIAAAEMLRKIESRARACYVDYDGCTLTKDTWVYIVKGVEPRTKHDFLADAMLAELAREQSK